ncbi:hypothetical protein [Helicobacter sp. T3_23-1056]
MAIHTLQIQKNICCDFDDIDCHAQQVALAMTQKSSLEKNPHNAKKPNAQKTTKKLTKNPPPSPLVLREGENFGNSAKGGGKTQNALQSMGNLYRHCEQVARLAWQSIVTKCQKRAF